MEIRGKGGRGLGEALYQALTGRSPRSAAKMSTQAKTRELVKNLGGSTRRAAEAAKVSMRTIQRRLAGKQQAKNTRAKRSADDLDRAQREARITPGRSQQFRKSATSPGAGQTGTGGLYIYGLIQVSEDIRERGIRPGPFIPAGDLDRVVDLMAAQGPDAAADELNALISQHYVAGMRVLTVETIEY